MSNKLYPVGSIVKVKSGGPIMIVFGTKGKSDESPMMPKDKDTEEGEMRKCFWVNRNEDPVLVEIPVECLEAATVFDPDHP